MRYAYLKKMEFDVDKQGPMKLNGYEYFFQTCSRPC